MRMKKTITIKPLTPFMEKIKNKFHSKSRTHCSSLSQLLPPKSLYHPIDLKAISRSILSSHNTTDSKFNALITNRILKTKVNHYNLTYSDMVIYISSKEYVKRFYSKEESRERLSKYFNYYKNYLRFFCKPSIADLKMNKMMVKNMEKVAQIFYSKNYENEKKKNKGKKEKMNRLFTEGVVNEIEKNKNDTNTNDVSIFDMSSILNNKKNQIVQNNTNDQSLNASINILLSLMNQSADNKKSLSKIKRPSKFAQQPSTPNTLILNAYNNFNFPINNYLSEHRLNSNSPLSQDNRRFKLNIKNILSKPIHKLNSKHKSSNIIPPVCKTKTPLNRLYSNTLIKNHSSSNLASRSQSRLTILSSPTIAHRSKHNNINYNNNSSIGKIDSSRLFSSGRITDKRNSFKKSLEESTRASGKDIINIPNITNNIKRIYPKIGSMTSMHRDIVVSFKGKIKNINRIQYEDIKKKGSFLNNSNQ